MRNDTVEALVEQVARAICCRSGQPENEVIHGSGWASADGRGGSMNSQYAWQKWKPAARAIIPLVLEYSARVAETYASVCLEKRDDQMHFGNMPGALTQARCSQTAQEVANAIRTHLSGATKP